MGNVRYNMIGPVDVPEETNSGLVLLPTNNTLIAMPFKGENGPRTPEVLPKDAIKSTEDIMEHCQPEVQVKLKTGNSENPEVNETIRFKDGVQAFSPKSIKNNTPLLRKLEAEFKASEALVDKIDKSAQFRKALDDPKAKEAIISMFKEIVQELEGSLPDTNED